MGRGGRSVPGCGCELPGAQIGRVCERKVCVWPARFIPKFLPLLVGFLVVTAPLQASRGAATWLYTGGSFSLPWMTGSLQRETCPGKDGKLLYPRAGDVAGD